MGSFSLVISKSMHTSVKLMQALAGNNDTPVLYLYQALNMVSKDDYAELPTEDRHRLLDKVDRAAVQLNRAIPSGEKVIYHLDGCKAKHGSVIDFMKVNPYTTVLDHAPYSSLVTRAARSVWVQVELDAVKETDVILFQDFSIAHRTPEMGFLALNTKTWELETLSREVLLEIRGLKGSFNGNPVPTDETIYIHDFTTGRLLGLAPTSAYFIGTSPGAGKTTMLLNTLKVLINTDPSAGYNNRADLVFPMTIIHRGEDAAFLIKVMAIVPAEYHPSVKVIALKEDEKLDAIWKHIGISSRVLLIDDVLSSEYNLVTFVDNIRKAGAIRPRVCAVIATVRTGSRDGKPVTWALHLNKQSIIQSNIPLSKEVEISSCN